MKTGLTGLVLLTLVLACSASRCMKPQKVIHRSAALCQGEQRYILRRKQCAVKAFKNLGIQCAEKHVPHITLLGSGGGQRAAVSLVGTLAQLSQDALLDTVLYLGGVSGSTWSMAPLYSDPQWSNRLDTHKTSLLSSQIERDVVLSWLNKTTQREDFSLTDMWGILTAVGIMKLWDTRRLSEEADRNVTNPYPVYGAIEKSCFNNGSVRGQWFELSPHEAGFPELEKFVETSLLGSSFSEGVLVKQAPEMDMIQLQGILGSAIANEDMEKYIPDWLKVPALMDTPAQNYLLSYNGLTTFINRTKPYITNTQVVGHLENLQGTLHDKVSEDRSEALQSLSPEQREQQFQTWTTELQTLVLQWSQTLPEGNTKEQVSLLVRKLLPLIIKWEWGTVKNFLYKYTEEPVPECLSAQQYLHLMDAGLLVNVAYPSFLGQRRDIDLLIAPEYSAGDMFETLTLARDYAQKVQKPFPELDDQVLLEEKDWPRPCYVFDGNNTAPTIVFMPLFNRNNCKDAAEWAQKMEHFRTFQTTFSPEMIQQLLDTAQDNVRKCKDVLVREIRKAAERRRSKVDNREGPPPQ